MGCMLLDSSPNTCTTTPSFRVAWASTCLILVWQSRKLRAITFLWISCSERKVTLSYWTESWTELKIHNTCIKTHRLPIDCFSWFAIIVQTTVYIRRVLAVKPERQKKHCSAAKHVLPHFKRSHMMWFQVLLSTHLREAGHRGPTIIYSVWKIMCFLNIKACQHILLHQIHK